MRGVFGTLATVLSVANASGFTATFQSEYVVGTVVFQSLPSGAGFTVDADLQHPGSIQVTYGHNWHIHAHGVDMRVGCSSAGGHWDPESNEIPGGDYLCSARAPSECFRGDLSGKLGPIQIGDLEHHIRTAASFEDPTLTSADLTGHSLVIHAAHMDARRVACANILPSADKSPVGTHHNPHRCLVLHNHRFSMEKSRISNRNSRFSTENHRLRTFLAILTPT